MPHIIVEHTADIEDIGALLNTLHQKLAGMDTIVLSDIKSRAITVNHAIIGDGHQNSMVHITLKLLPGRDPALVKTMVQSLHNAACDHCQDNVRITAESLLIDKETYHK